jgi:hypothetical protein
MSFWCLLNSWFPFLDLNSSITTHLVKQPQSRPSNNNNLGSNAVYSILFIQDTVHLIFILLPQIDVIFMKATTTTTHQQHTNNQQPTTTTRTRTRTNNHTHSNLFYNIQNHIKTHSRNKNNYHTITKQIIVK